MAVETNKGSDAPISPAQTLTGVAAAANGQLRPRRKRPSSLMAVATSLPSVESSLDEFIARANQTLSDPSEWRAAEQNAKAEDDNRREADALRWKAAEHQMREGEAREQSLRRQLDGLQGRLAEAEARAAVASNGTHDGVIADLKIRLTRSEERAYAAEEHTTRLAQELAAAKSATQSMPLAPTASAAFFNQGDADDRVRLAEAKAAKAIAAARAAAAGLTVSQADIAAIESGLVVTDHAPAKGTNWLAVSGAFVVGLAIMFVVAKFALNTDASKAAAAPAPATTDSVVDKAAKPIVTPIEDDKAAADKAAADKAAAPSEPAVDKPAADKAAAEQPTLDPIPAKKAAPAKKTAPVKTAGPKVVPKKTPKASAGGNIADPFAKPTKTAPKAPDKKPAGGIVDPF